MREFRIEIRRTLSFPGLCVLCVLVSYGGLVRSRSQAPGPPSLRPAKLGYARPKERRNEMKITDTTDRLSSGLKDRHRAKVVVSTLGNSPYRCLGLEPVSAR